MRKCHSKFRCHWRPWWSPDIDSSDRIKIYWGVWSVRIDWSSRHVEIHAFISTSCCLGAESNHPLNLSWLNSGLPYSLTLDFRPCTCLWISRRLFSSNCKPHVLHLKGNCIYYWVNLTNKRVFPLQSCDFLFSTVLKILVCRISFISSIRASFGYNLGKTSFGNVLERISSGLDTLCHIKLEVL